MPLLTGDWGSQASLSGRGETAELILQHRFYCQCLPMLCSVHHCSGDGSLAATLPTDLCSHQ